MHYDLTKLITLILVVSGALILTFTGHLESQACVALLGAALGYVFGNGHAVIEDRQLAVEVKNLAHEVECVRKEGGQL